MTILHCIESGCAEVRHKPYINTESVRFTYPGERERIVSGDDWRYVPLGGQCYTGYTLTFEMTVREYSLNGSGEVTASQDFSANLRIRTFNRYRIASAPYPDPDYVFERAGATLTRRMKIDAETIHGSSLSFQSLFYNPRRYNNGAYIIGTERNLVYTPHSVEPEYCKAKCRFEVLKKGKVVYSREDDNCPHSIEIDTGVCELSERYETIKVEKVPYLERIEIRDQDIQGHGIGGTLIDSSPLPTECLNIYKTFTAAPPFPNNTVPTAAIFNPYEFVAQICSDVGCPPPEYTVVCRCGEECPAGTCPVFCGDHVCCHDPNTGNSVYQIPLGEYSGGDS